MAEFKLNGRRYDVQLNPNTEVGKERFHVVGINSDEAYCIEGVSAFAQTLIEATQKGEGANTERLGGGVVALVSTILAFATIGVITVIGVLFN
jgi:hypothetical protein